MCENLILFLLKGTKLMKAEYFIQDMIDMVREVQIDLLVWACDLDNGDI
jgi:hypothetical protein